MFHWQILFLKKKQLLDLDTKEDPKSKSRSSAQASNSNAGELRYIPVNAEIGLAYLLAWFYDFYAYAIELF